jgi:hypothetical protein
VAEIRVRVSSQYTAIVAALQSVAGLNPATEPPDVPAPGAAWPAWTGAGPGAYCGLIDRWVVYVVLPNATRRQTLDSADTVVDAVWAALMEVGEVSNVAPGEVTINDPANTGQTLPVLAYTLTTVGRPQ